ncbi:hypothetical protein [Pseudomonas yamanorum]|uniref:Uncharacterized protein n=1 Tax=Pseudomonas yamanorum TaxID=515393 RepID=A0A7Y8K549_9PSED|nr:hypothetical protein [Pseudomonas yamanorum]NVZ85631.1 hypothetical protein [Pseudomonas yamanorum]NWE11841.1 hypothetical protein [Pseudomonas yamanorum]NWE75250.1 hypothetical protein [Pseudomonas yamanorum]
MSSVGKPYQTFAPPPPPQPTPAALPSTAYDQATPEDIAEAFVKNSSQFVDKKTGELTLEKLIAVGNRKPTGNAATDGITALALAVLQHSLFDGDLIDRSEEFLRTGGRGEKTKGADAKKDLPVGGRGDGLQRHRVESSDKDNGQLNAYRDKKPEDLADNAMARFSSLADADGFISDKSLAAVAAGKHQDGTPATQSEINLANALMDAPGLFRGLDGDKDGKFDGKISRDDLAQFQYTSMKPDVLLKGINEHFSELWVNGSKDYINVGELELAAGIQESSKTYSPELRALAKQLLGRPELLRELDIGIKSDGKTPGDEDGRFDKANLDYLIKKYASSEQKIA